MLCMPVKNLQPCSTKNDYEKTICCKDNGRSVGRDLHSTEAASARCVKKDEKTSWKRSFRLWGESSVRNALLHSHEDLCLNAQHHACKLHQFISAIQVFGRCREEALWSALSSLAELVSSRITERHWSLKIRWEVTGDNSLWTAHANLSMPTLIRTHTRTLHSTGCHGAGFESPLGCWWLDKEGEDDPANSTDQGTEVGTLHPYLRNSKYSWRCSCPCKGEAKRKQVSWTERTGSPWMLRWRVSGLNNPQKEVAQATESTVWKNGDDKLRDTIPQECAQEPCARIGKGQHLVLLRVANSLGLKRWG